MSKSSKAAHPTFAAEVDEVSLADARSDSTSSSAPDAVPDSLDVRSDSLMVMSGTLQRLRRPAVAVAVGLAVTVAALVAVSFLTRGRVDPAAGRVR